MLVLCRDSLSSVVPVDTRNRGQAKNRHYSTSLEDPQTVDDSPSDSDFDPPSSKSRSSSGRRRSTRRTPVKYTKPEDDKLMYVVIILCFNILECCPQGVVSSRNTSPGG